MQLAVAIEKTLSGFMAENNVDVAELRAMLMGMLAGGAIQGGHSIEEFVEDARAMYAATRALMHQVENEGN